MEFFLFQLVPNIPTLIKLWASYVDDMFVFFSPNYHDLNDYLISLNMLSDSIKFTIQLECEQNIPFLDILVRRTESNFE